MHFIRVIHTVNVTHNGVPIYIDSISKDEDTANIHSLNQSNSVELGNIKILNIDYKYQPK